MNGIWNEFTMYAFRLRWKAAWKNPYVLDRMNIVVNWIRNFCCCNKVCEAELPMLFALEVNGLPFFLFCEEYSPKWKLATTIDLSSQVSGFLLLQTLWKDSPKKAWSRKMAFYSRCPGFGGATWRFWPSVKFCTRKTSGSCQFTKKGPTCGS